MNTPINWDEISNRLAAYERQRRPEDQWYVMMHPDLAKHHPTIKYLKRYRRRGIMMKKKKR